MSKFRAFPTRSTQRYLERITELNRILYNNAIIERRNAYKHSKKSLSYFDQCYHIKVIREENPEYMDMDARVLYRTLKRVQDTYQKFFDTQKMLRETGQPLTDKGKLIGYPKLKKRDDYSTITYEKSGWKLDQDKKIIFLTRGKDMIGKIKYLADHKVNDRIKQISITKSKTNKWWIQIIYEYKELRPSPATGKIVGIDLGVKALVVDSDGRFWNNPRFLAEYDNKINEWKTKKDKLPKGDNRKEKYQRAENRLNEKLANKRRQLAREIAAYYANNYDIVCIEDIKIAKISKKAKTEDLNEQLTRSMDQAKNKQILSAGMGQIRSMIKNALTLRGKQYIEVDPAYTSQRCSKCGSRNSAMSDVEEREFYCPNCNNVMDRDLNAAVNILKRGEHDLQKTKAA